MDGLYYMLMKNKKNKELVLAAVKQNGDALKFADNLF